MSRFLRRLRLLVGRGRFEADVKKELEFHVAMETEQRQRSGQPADDARRTALRDFGGVSRIREEVRDARGLAFWDAVVQDLRYGLRTLAGAPGYTAAAVAILALSIGANTAMFSVLNGVLFAPLPFRDGQDLVLVQQSAPQSNRANAGVSIQELQDYRRRLTTVEDLVEYHQMSFTLLNEGEPDRVDTGVVSANFFDMLGIRPELGRSFADRDDDIGAEAVLILSHAYWLEKFGGDPKVIGRVLEMNNRAHTVIGVLPDYPEYPRANDVYMPTSACPFRASAETNPRQGHRSFAGLRVFGRLAPGATPQAASAEIAGVARRFEQDDPQDYDRWNARGLTGEALPLGEQLVSNARRALYVLAGVTLLVLVIACANVANLALARTMRRGRELAVRTALGASRGRLLRQLLTESLLLSLVGGALGIAIASLSLDLLVAFVGRFTPRTGQIAIDGRVLGFALVVSVVTGIVFGIAPALAARRNLSSGMRDGGTQAGESAGRHRVRAALVVAQVAVSFALVVGAALLLESFYRLATTPLGFETEHVMSAAIFGNFTSQATMADSARFEADVLRNLRTSPGIRAAALTGAVPQSAISPDGTTVWLEGAASDGPRQVVVDQNYASDQYFDTLGVPILAGRDFQATDTMEAPAVAIINQSMAKLWNGVDPVGRRFTAQLMGGAEATFTVVGIAADYRLYGVEQENPAQYYRATSQAPGSGSRLLVRTDGEPAGAVPAIKAAVHAADPDTPVEDIATIAQIRNTTQLAAPGLTAALLGLFALVALTITLTGIAGVISTSVSQRTREFGLRMALGASRWSVLRQVVGQGVVLTIVGIVLGLAGASFFSRLLSSFLFETPATDLSAHLGVALIFLAAALLAAAGPARRATSIDPLRALRSE
ncbi:MAG: ABC transporter permease [Vicinamibacterales bacterium]